ncbi:MAG TPA: 2-oxo acid dehydrogenase subunit E2 [Jatrophihabitantaceae bacterium]|jgi:2-oxoglutarate dehydrogenase E2 component (dihydrolipoamide succinyltransferase)
MPVSVTMPRLGESVTEGTVTRWLKQEGEHVDADEPLLEVSTDKVDTEVPSPASGTVLSIKVREDETVEIGVELAVIGDAADAGQPAVEQPPADQPVAEQPPADQPVAAQPPADASASAAPPPFAAQPVAEQVPTESYPAPAAAQAAQPPPAEPSWDRPGVASGHPSPAQSGDSTQPFAPAPVVAPAAMPSGEDDGAGPYVTPLVRKLASERGVDLAAVRGTGIGGRIRKSDVLAAAGAAAQAPLHPTEGAPPAHAAPIPAAPIPTPSPVTPPAAAPAAAPPFIPAGLTAAAPAAAETATAPRVASATGGATEGLRGRVVPMSRMRQVIAARMVESLQTAAQLTTVVEVDVTKIWRLRAQAKAGFQAREGVKLTFLPFFAVAAIEALKAHPVVNASIDVEAKTITYHDTEHLGIAVDTERGLAVPVIHNAGDLNLAGIARKIADLAERTRANRVSPDELGGGTFTLTNTGSRGALFDTPIINQPQVAILGTGAVVRRPMVVADGELGETISIRSMVYLALSYDHRIVDGADAARFLGTIKERLEAGAFERALGLG